MIEKVEAPSLCQRNDCAINSLKRFLQLLQEEDDDSYKMTVEHDKLLEVVFGYVSAGISSRQVATIVLASPSYGLDLQLLSVNHELFTGFLQALIDINLHKIRRVVLHPKVSAYSVAVGSATKIHVFTSACVYAQWLQMMPVAWLGDTKECHVSVYQDSTECMYCAAYQLDSVVQALILGLSRWTKRTQKLVRRSGRR